MSELFNSLRQLLRGLRLWVVISPWEQALRVRCGKHVKQLGAGMHLRIPLLDVIYLQSVRLRVSGMGRQTVTTRDGRAVTFAGSIGYSITDVMKLYKTLHHAEDTIANLARSMVAQYIYTHDAVECQPAMVQEHINKNLDFMVYGLSQAGVFLTEFAVIRTFRLVGDYSPTQVSNLSTIEPHGSGNGYPS